MPHPNHSNWTSVTAIKIKVVIFKYYRITYFDDQCLRLWLSYIFQFRIGVLFLEYYFGSINLHYTLKISANEWLCWISAMVMDLFCFFVILKKMLKFSNCFNFKLCLIHVLIISVQTILVYFSSFFNVSIYHERRQTEDWKWLNYTGLFKSHIFFISELWNVGRLVCRIREFSDVKVWQFSSKLFEKQRTLKFITVCKYKQINKT